MVALYNHYQKDSLNRDSLLQNEDFVNDARVFLNKRGRYKEEDLQDPTFVYDKYLEHFRGQNTNEVTAARDLFYARSKRRTEEELAGMGRLMDTYDKMDGEFGWKAVGDYFEGVATAPSTYAGMFSFGAGKAGALAGQQAIKHGIRSIVSKKFIDSRAVAKQGLKSAGIGFGIDATAAGGTVALQEQTRVEANLKEKMDLKNIGIGTVIGGVAGTAFGGYAGIQKFKTSRTGAFLGAKNLKKLRAIKEEVHKNHVKPILTATENSENIKLGKTANEIKDYLTKTTKLPLEKTVPKQLAEGKVLAKTRQERFEIQEIENIAVAAARIDEILPELPGVAGGGVERISSRLTRAITTDKDFLDSVDPILAKHKISFEHLAPLFVEEISRSASIMGVVGRLGKKPVKGSTKMYEESVLALNKLDNTLLASGYSAMSNRARIALEKTNQHEMKKAGIGFLRLNKARIGFMTTQIATTVRNTSNGYLRNYIYALDNLNTGAFNVAKGKIDGKVWNYNNALKEKQVAINPITKIAYTKKESEAILKIQGKNIVALGQAQLRNGRQSVFLKDMAFGLMSEETDALFKILANPEFAFSSEISKLLRGMGDIGEIKQVESGILGLAQKLNYFNSLSDNLFKRAVFTRELDMLINASPLGKKGELDTLNKVISEGRFNEVPKDYLSRSMTEAWEFTYQTGDFASRAGTANSLANGFIKGFKNPFFEILRSFAIPFPRYMVNQFRFVYTHAPLLGMINLGGILNKPITKTQDKQLSSGVLTATKEITGMNLVVNADTLGKQVTGLAMLGAFIGIRHKYGDETTKAYEYNIDGSKYDVRAALGPFTMYAYLADLLYRSDFLGAVSSVGLPTAADKGNVDTGELDDKLYNNLIASYRDNPWDVSEFVGALTGSTSRSGSQLYLLKKAERYLQGIEDSEGFALGSAKFLGSIVNTGLIPLAMLKDIAATTDTPFSNMEDYILLPNNSADIRKEDTMVSFWEVFIRQATRSLPKSQGEDNERLPLQSSTRRGGILRYNPIIKQLTGLTPMVDLTNAERELSRLGLNYNAVTPKRIENDSERNNKAKYYMAEYVEYELAPIIDSDEYKQERTNSGRKAILLKLLSEYKSSSRAKAMADIGAEPEDDDYQEKLAKYFSTYYNNIPNTKKLRLQDRYQQFNDELNKQANVDPNEWEQVSPDEDPLAYHMWVFSQLER